jgi:hypothetical protein
MNHQRGMEEINPGDVLGQVGRARDYKQQGEHPRTEQRQYAQPEPPQCQQAAGVLRHLQTVILIRRHCNLKPSLKLATMTWAGRRLTSWSSTQG